jgi:hypothetical protein
MSVPPPEKKAEIRVYQLNDELADFEELELSPDMKLVELLNPNSIFLFIEAATFRSFIWAGSQTSTRMKFIAAQKAPNIRDKIGPAIKITSVDEGDETTAFKVMMGLISPEEFNADIGGPAYTGTDTDHALLEDLSLEKIILLLEKIGTPTGWKREMVLDGKNMYGYHMAYKEYMGEIIEERRLYRLQEPVPDGLYMREGLVPRFVMQRNKVIITEFYRKMTLEEIEAEAQKATKVAEIQAKFSPMHQS